MEIITRFNVQTVSHGTALYLDRDCEWTTDAEAASPYDCEDEANDDADKHGGEVFKFQSWVPGHNERARLEMHFQQMAAG